MDKLRIKLIVGVCVSLGWLCAWCASARAAGGILDVGPGGKFARIEDALRAARPGDVIRVHPLDGDKAYVRPALKVHTAGITFQAVLGPKGQRVKLDGQGFDYAGDAVKPRAVFEFDPGADGCTVEGFEMSNARNGSNNGAGVRINAANNITIRNCDIHNCDNGAMSNGELAKGTGANIFFDGCVIHHNGSPKNVGQTHNMYMGGTSVIVHACEIYESTVGHNFKCRAHYARVEYSYIHEAADREFDLVQEAGNTTAPNSDAVIIGNLIIKKANTKGNAAVIHFGQDSKQDPTDHNGMVYIVQNTIVTAYAAPVVELSAPRAGAALEGNLLWSNARTGTELAAFRGGAKPDRLWATYNWFSPGFDWPRAGGHNEHNWFARPGEGPSFAEASKEAGHLTGPLADYFAKQVAAPVAKLKLPVAPGEKGEIEKLQQYKSVGTTEARPDNAKPAVGAFAAGS